VLIQGDSLWRLHEQLSAALKEGAGVLSEESRLELEDVRDFVGGCLDHYRAVLRDHGMDLPFAK